jgi:lysophospholipase L1-like esterase
LQFSVAATPAPERSIGEVLQFGDGDRWCVLGDSITRTGMYGDYVELFYITRYPNRRVEVINCGVAGDTADGALLRLDCDCLEKNPTVVTVMFGMNDVGRDLYTPDTQQQDLDHERATKIEQYEQAMRRLTERLLAAGVKVVVVRPSIFDDSAQLDCPNRPGVGAALRQLGQRVDSLAEEFQVDVIDFNTPMEEINRGMQQQDPRFTIVGPDRVHPSEPGHFVMAYQLLAAQEHTGVVSCIEVDAISGRIDRAENCEVDGLEAHPKNVVFNCLAESLPFPVERAAVPALQFVPFTKQLNNETLRVSGLSAGGYELQIDDVAIGVFSAKELAAGINLATQPNTPQMEQATLVLNKLREKWSRVAKLRSVAYCEHCVRRRARNFQGDSDAAAYLTDMIPTFSEPGYQKYLEAQRDTYLEVKPVEAKVKREIQNIQNDAYALSQPKRHRYEIKRSGEERLSKVPSSTAE